METIFVVGMSGRAPNLGKMVLMKEITHDCFCYLFLSSYEHFCTFCGASISPDEACIHRSLILLRCVNTREICLRIIYHVNISREIVIWAV